MHKTRVFVSLAVLVCALTATALGDSDARIVRLSYLSGEVQLDRRDGRGYEGGFLNMPVTESMRLWTRGDGFAEVELEDGSTVRLTPDTRVEFVELRRRSTGQTVTLVEFQEGVAYLNLRGGDDEFRLVFGRNQEVRIERSANFRISIDRSSLELAVTKGRLEIITSSGSVEVRKGETISFNVDNPSRYVLVDEVREARFDDWDRDRDGERDRYAARRERDIRYPYAYGVADLDYYGTYVYVPGYGYVWRPSYVATGWSPFQDGAWVWYPGYGYVWVSSYPWGWVPYRYGTWVYLNNHGWCWQPNSGSWQWAAAPRVGDRWGHHRPPGHNRGTVPIGRGYRDVWDEERDRARRDNARDGEESIFTRARREGDRRRAENSGAPAAPPASTPVPPASEPAPPAADSTRRSGPQRAPDADGGTIFERARREGDERRNAPATPAPAPAPESRRVPPPERRGPSKPTPVPSSPAPSVAPAPSAPAPSAPAGNGWGSSPPSSGSSGSSDSGSRSGSKDSTPTRDRRVPN